MGNQLEFDLNEAFKKPEKAKEIVKKVQTSFTELTDACLAMKEAAKESEKLNLEYAKQVQHLTNANVDMVTAMKNIHIILSSRQELFKDDKEMQEVMLGLATFVTGSGAIKMGVLAKAKEVKNG